MKNRVMAEKCRQAGLTNTLKAAQEHTCHAIGCTKPVAPFLLMCARHWHMVPQRLQVSVWAQYRPSQEIFKNPSANYLAAARDAINAVAEKEGRTERMPMPAQEGVK